MKKFSLILMLALLPCVWLIQGREETKRLVVPKGKTYVKLDTSGHEIGRFTTGQTMTRTVDCAQVPCPGTFGPDVVCWKCKERPENVKATGVSEERVGPTTTTATATPRVNPDRMREVTGTAATTTAEKVVVPSGKTYVKLDTAGHEVARFSSGQTMARTVDCAQVPCPGTFGPDVVCWKCKERPDNVVAPAKTRQ
jgi:hypothetical protein